MLRRFGKIAPPCTMRWSACPRRARAPGRHAQHAGERWERGDMTVQASTGDASRMAPDSSTGQPRTWFITGSSSGIGRALARALLERGERVAATATDVRALDDLTPIAEDQLWTAELDVTQLEQVRDVVER